MKVVYSGCRYNSIVFAMDESQKGFHRWLNDVHAYMSKAILADPVKYKFTGRGAPTFLKDIVTENSSDLYPDELRCRLSIERTGNDINDTKITSVFLDKDNNIIPPSQIYGGGIVLPIFKASYYKEGDDYGLQLTMLKGLYEAPESTKVSNDDWQFASVSI
jgi:hypothetical protein